VKLTLCGSVFAGMAGEVSYGGDGSCCFSQS
jgi:hypothetical protein